MAGLFDIFSNRPARDAAAAMTRNLQAGETKARGDITGGLGQAQGYYDRALEYYNPVETSLGTGDRGYGAYADAVGLNGPEGAGRAMEGFKTANPSFNFDLSTGIDALTRAGNATGAAVGNVLTRAQEYGTNLANKTYGDYVSRLSPYLNQPGQRLALAGAQAGNLQGAGNLAYGAGGQLGNLAMTTAQGIGQAQRDAELARYGTSANALGALMSGANLLTRGFGFGGGGGSGSSPFNPLGNLFNSNGSLGVGI